MTYTLCQIFLSVYHNRDMWGLFSFHFISFFILCLFAQCSFHPPTTSPLLYNFHTFLPYQFKIPIQTNTISTNGIILRSAGAWTCFSLEHFPLTKRYMVIVRIKCTIHIQENCFSNWTRGDGMRECLRDIKWAFKGVIWCDFKFSFLFGVLKAICA